MSSSEAIPWKVNCSLWKTKLIGMTKPRCSHDATVQTVNDFTHTPPD
jgi:hypothetical protein